jgi:hypothetical protein
MKTLIQKTIKACKTLENHLLINDWKDLFTNYERPNDFYRHAYIFSNCNSKDKAVVLYDTVVFTYINGVIQLNTGGFFTKSTKELINVGLRNIGFRGFGLYQKDFKWYLNSLEFSNNMTLKY